MYIQSQHNQPAAIHLFLYYTDPDTEKHIILLQAFLNLHVQMLQYFHYPHPV